MPDYKKYLNPQFTLTVMGVFMLGLSMLIYSIAEPIVSSPANQNSANLLKVEPANSSPSSTINHIQGSSGLQSQDSQALQRPIGEQLQPNAKTNDITPAQTVQ